MNWNIREFGAAGDGAGNDTAALQKAIDTAGDKGGGTVLVPPGTYRTGSIFLRSGVVLHLEAGAVLSASVDLSEYKEMTLGHNVDRQPYHLIVAEGRENCGITGKGTIEGNGESFWYPREGEGARPGNYKWFMRKEKRVSPLLEVLRCRGFFLKDITIRNSPGWTCHFHDCDRLRVEGVTIDNNLFGPNTDGLDINGCRDVFIRDCRITTGDDAIVLKTTPDSRSCEGVIVTGCILQTNCVALKLGATESYHTIRDVLFSDCIIRESNRGIGLYSFNGALYDTIHFRNIQCDTHNGMTQNRPIHIELRKTEQGAGGMIRNVLIDGFSSRTSGRILMTAQEGTWLENITLNNLSLQYSHLEDAPVEESRIESGLGTFSNFNPWSRKANAAIVAENVKNLRISHVLADWPERPSAFPFALFQGRSIRRGTLQMPLAAAPGEADRKMILEDCDHIATGQSE